MLSKLKSEKRHRSVFFYLTVFIVVAFVVGNILYMNAEIAQKRSELESINDELYDINVKNEQLRHYSSNENRMEYIEQIARDQLDYSHSDETVYYFIPK